MKRIKGKILEQAIAATAEPLVLVRVEQSDWPIVLANAAFAGICPQDVLERPFADVIEELTGRDLALEVSESIRLSQETNFPIEFAHREYLLVVKPLYLAREDQPRYYAVYWRRAGATGSAESAEMHQALLKAKRRIRDLSRDDPITGLLNDRAFRDVFEHDWAVAKRERSSLSVILFALDDFDAYEQVFGRHAADSCLRRTGNAIRRHLRRASDVIARPGPALFLVLSHAADESGVRQFAELIATSVRELGLHHPRSRAGRFVTASFEVAVTDVAAESRSAREFLDDLLGRVAE